MNRPEWVEAGARAWARAGGVGGGSMALYRLVGAVIDAVEPLIVGHADATHICTDAIERARADERAKCDPGFIGTAMKLMADERADLATKVEALPTRGIGARVLNGELVTYALVERDEVLALFEEARGD